MSELEKIIRPIVEGQIRSFIYDHPSILLGVDWYKPRQDKTETLINSLSKRIMRDLLCANTSARMGTALLPSRCGVAVHWCEPEIVGWANYGADLESSPGSAP